MNENAASQSGERKKRRTRCRRKAKPLYERSGPKYFGHDMQITYNDLRDIAAAINDNSRVISNEVRKGLPIDLLNAIDSVNSNHQELMICSLFARMHKQNLDALIARIQEIAKPVM